MEAIIQAVVSGLLLGGVYALIATGLNIIFGVVKITNFAHGELVMLAMYMTWFLWTTWSVNPYVALFIVTPLMFLSGVLLQKIVLEPMQDSSANMKIFVTLGLSVFLQNLMLFLYGGQFRTVTVGWADQTISIGGITATNGRLLAFVVAVLLVVGIFYLMNRTMIGRVLAAVSEDRDTARMIGIPVRKFYLLAMGLGAAMTGIAGVLIIPFQAAYPMVGAHYTLMAFVVVVIGGLGNMTGALIGGLCLGIIETLTGTFIDPALQQVAVFIVFIIVLIVRPAGLFGGSIRNVEVGLK